MKAQLVCEEAIEARCAHFGTCGGCRFQHISYDSQLEQKQAHIEHIFDSAVDPILPCDSPWEYRNKMEFSFSQDLAGNKYLGLMMRAKRGRVVNLEECHLVDPWMATTLTRVRQWWEDSALEAYHPPKDQGHLRTLTLRHGRHTGEKMALLTVAGAIEPDLSGFIEAIGPIDSVLFRQQIIAKKKPTRFVEHLLVGKDHIHELLHDEQGHPFRFKIRAASFFQPNTFQAEKLYAMALDFLDLQGDETLFDLYCGTGTLGIFAHSKVKSVLGVEMCPEAVADAKENVRLNNASNVQIMEADVGKLEFEKKPDVVIVDPPRAGLSSQAIEHLLALAPQKILYISCNPSSQAKNIEDLAGYKIIALQPVDQFPHTPHIENIALLHRL